MTREFEELALDVHNYPTWAMDVKIGFALQGMYESIVPPDERIVPLLDPYKYNALYIIRNHIHPDLKSEYVMEEEPSMLWTAIQTRYEQHNDVILPKANHDWTHLRLQDYKSIEDYNHAVHKICVSCVFVRKNLSKWIRMKRHFKLFSIRIGSYNINTVPRITNITWILFMI
jgi:hypothetical protein